MICTSELAQTCMISKKAARDVKSDFRSEFRYSRAVTDSPSLAVLRNFSMDMQLAHNWIFYKQLLSKLQFKLRQAWDHVDVRSRDAQLEIKDLHNTVYSIDWSRSHASGCYSV